MQTISNHRQQMKGTHRHSAGTWPIAWLGLCRRSGSQWPWGQGFRCDRSSPPAGSSGSTQPPRETTGWPVCPGWWSPTWWRRTHRRQNRVWDRTGPESSGWRYRTWHSLWCSSSEGCCRTGWACNELFGYSTCGNSGGKTGNVFKLFKKIITYSWITCFMNKLFKCDQNRKSSWPQPRPVTPREVAGCNPAERRENSSPPMERPPPQNGSKGSNLNGAAALREWINRFIISHGSETSNKN